MEKMNRFYTLSAVLIMVCISFLSSSHALAESEITNKIEIVKSRMMFDLVKSINYLDASIKNVSPDIVVAPIKVVIDSISDSRVSVANADGVTDDNKPYFEYTNDIGGLSSGTEIAAKRWQFSNPNRLRFSFTTAVYAEVPQAAAIIGTEGGLVRVDDPNSELFGTEIDIPLGVSTEETFVTIDFIESLELPNKNTLIGPIANIRTTKPFQGYVKVRLPISEPIKPNEQVVIYTQDEGGGWDIIPAVLAEPGFVTYETTHFSPHIPTKVEFDPNSHELGKRHLLLFNMYKTIGFPALREMEMILINKIQDKLKIQLIENTIADSARIMTGAYTQYFSPNLIGFYSLLSDIKGLTEDISRSAYDNEELSEAYTGLARCQIEGILFEGGVPGVVKSCTSEVALSLVDLVFRIVAVMDTDDLLDKINNINIANDYLILYYMYGTDLYLMADQERLLHDGEPIPNSFEIEGILVERIADKYKKGWFAYNDYNLSKIKELIEKAKNRMEKASDGKDTDGDGILDDGDGDGEHSTPCAEGGYNGCDDNCKDEFNPNQADSDNDGTGDSCELPPRVTSFNLLLNHLSVGDTLYVNYTVTDDQGLAQIELWRSSDVAGNPGEDWQKINSNSLSGTADSYVLYDSPPIGTWWYGLHVIDTDGNCTTEKNLDCTSANSNGGGEFGPLPVTVSPLITCADNDGDNYDTCDLGEPGDDGKAKDCDDNSSEINPGAEEICGDNKDNNCNGQIDENCNLVDSDGDGILDSLDEDDDNDGHSDTEDAFPLDPSEWADSDGDGIGDNADTVDNSVPANLTATYQPEHGWIYITWDPVPGADKYHVYWGTEPFVTKTSELLTPTSTCDYGHTGVVPGYTYYYRVAAVAANGNESELSKQVFAYVPYATGTGRIPDTGQTTSYTSTFGEDSDYTINPQSYTKLDANGNDLPDSAISWAMIRDNVTGLIWENKTDDGTIHDKDNFYSWYAAQDVFIAQLNAANFGGHDDWRLPTVKELAMLVHADKPYPGPTINTTYFEKTNSSYYWSSTTYAYNSGCAWRVHFHYGSVDYYNKSYSYYVRAVRGGQ